MQRVVLAAISCALLMTSTVRAEPLRGKWEMTAGGHAMILAAEACEIDRDGERCKDATGFAGFDLGGNLQVVPWFAVGLRAGVSIELGTSGSQVPGRDHLTTIQRQLLLWQFALLLRFDPSIFPRGLWFGAEIGTALAVNGINEVDGADNTLAEESSTTPALLLAAVAGYDIGLGDRYLLGFTFRGQYIGVSSLPGLSVEHFGERELKPFPYLALGVHMGVRW